METYRNTFGLEPRRGQIGKSNHHSVASNESLKAARVSGSCMMQRDVLSIWWRQALQSFVQARMWMNMRPPESDALLPTRYERLYQPHKLAQFDRFFLRSWAIPVGREHFEQQVENSYAGSKVLMRAVSPAVTRIWKEEKVAPEQDQESLAEVIGEAGFEFAHEPQLKRFVAHHDRRLVSESAEKYMSLSTPKPATACPEYERHVAPLSGDYEDLATARPEAADEFKAYLEPFRLTSDNVAGIREVSYCLLQLPTSLM